MSYLGGNLCLCVRLLVVLVGEAHVWLPFVIQNKTYLESVPRRRVLFGGGHDDVL